MIKVHHLNCGILHKPPLPKAICYCMLLESETELALVDTGIGLHEVKDPLRLVGKEMIEMAGFQFHEELTAVRQIERMGMNPNDVKHIILSHLDNDHAGGLADFPQAKVHVSKEEFEAFQKGSYRYLPQQVAHQPDFVLHTVSNDRWFDLEARKLDLPFSSQIMLIPLFGHTKGHCGVAIERKERWIFYIGDAYYLKAELQIKNHPIDNLATLRAENNADRLKSLAKVRLLLKEYGDQIDCHGYHDEEEFIHSTCSKV